MLTAAERTAWLKSTSERWSRDDDLSDASPRQARIRIAAEPVLLGRQAALPDYLRIRQTFPKSHICSLHSQGSRMSNYGIPGSLCVSNAETIDKGTLCRLRSAAPGSLGIDVGPEPVDDALVAEEGLQVVLTPVQLAAVLAGETLETEPSLSSVCGVSASWWAARLSLLARPGCC